jgi:hypothetical protein
MIRRLLLDYIIVFFPSHLTPYQEIPMRRAGRPPRVHTPTMMVVAYDAWRVHGTLRKAAAELQLSHERVRQLVRQAWPMDLFRRCS